MKLLYKSAIALFFGLALVFATGCGSEQSTSEEDAKAIEVDASDIEEETEQVQNVFYALPSPFEVATLLKASGAEFEADVLNDPEKVANYLTTQSKAINLGIYGADLSIATVYNKTQETVLYLKAIKQLADELGLTSAFDAATMDRLEKSKDVQDSLQRIVAESYMMANAYLKENARSSTATLVLVGGWIEGVHIATSLVDVDNPNEELKGLIADQRFSIENLIALLNMHSDEAGITNLVEDFKELNKLFLQIEESEKSTTEKAEGKSTKMVIGGETELNFSPELLKTIVLKVEEIRTKFVG